MPNRRGLRLITVFGLGAMRPAPGTWGSLPPVLLAAGLIAAGLGPSHAPILYHLIVAIVFLIACGACITEGDRAEAIYLRKDPSDAVADETAGQCFPLMAIPAAALATPALAIFTLFFAFIAFRIFDIFKPWPANALQSEPGGWGILLDDLVAGLYALILVQALALLML